MKRLKYLAVVACAALAAGCEHMFDEYNSDPNNTEMWQIHPESMMEQLLFSAADELMYGTWQLNGELMQYTVNLQSENIHRYIIRDSYANTPWNYLSKWAANADHMRRLAILKEEPNCQAIALTMRALWSPTDRPVRQHPLQRGLQGTRYRRHHPAQIRHPAGGLYPAAAGPGAGQLALRR